MPAPALERGVADAGVLRHRQIGMRLTALEHAADAEGLGPVHRIGGLELPADADPSPVGRTSAGQNVYQAALLAPLWPTSPTHLRRHRCGNRLIESADGAEMPFDAVQFTMFSTLSGIGGIEQPRSWASDRLFYVRLDGGERFILSVLVGGNAALGDLRQLGLEVGLVEGEIRHQVCRGDVLAAIEWTCWATQKREVYRPGATEADQVW